MKSFNELPYGVSYRKKHDRPYGRGWGWLLYPAHSPRYWLKFFNKAKKWYFSFFPIILGNNVFGWVLNHCQLPKWAFESQSWVQCTIPSPRTSHTLVAENLLHWRSLGEKHQDVSVYPRNIQNATKYLTEVLMIDIKHFGAPFGCFDTSGAQNKAHLARHNQHQTATPWYNRHHCFLVCKF